MAARGSLFQRLRFYATETVREIGNDDLMTLAAALSFYTVLSLSPLLILLVWLAANLGMQNQEALVQQVVALIGPQAGEAVKGILQNENQTPTLGTIAGILGFVALLVSAGGVFGQLQVSLNRIFNVKPPAKTNIWMWLKKRLLSFGMVFSIGFVAMVSLVVSAIVGAIAESMGPLARVAELAGSIGLFTLVFSGIFKVLPDIKLSWREVWFGGFLTALLFTVGKWLIGLYLGQSSVGSTYGAAGSLVILLVWVYYSSIIVFIGAEITQVWMNGQGSRHKPPVESDLDGNKAERPARDEPGRAQQIEREHVSRQEPERPAVESHMFRSGRNGVRDERVNRR